MQAELAEFAYRSWPCLKPRSTGVHQAQLDVIGKLPLKRWFMKRREDPALARIVSALALVDLAASLGISVQAVSQWRRVPGARVLEVERITGVSRYEIRPDIYGLGPTRVASKQSRPKTAPSDAPAAQVESRP